MSLYFAITPDPSTYARMVRHDVPSLVLSDGSATVWVSPGDGPYAAWEATRVADTLVRAAEAFGRACEQLAHSASGGPLVVPRSEEQDKGWSDSPSGIPPVQHGAVDGRSARWPGQPR
ncbi:MAG: hypothetical protein M3Q39_07100 [Actinomycetota bacterium]|nr:hypothetical protein [Actinomycetota bacterium]